MKSFLMSIFAGLNPVLISIVISITSFVTFLFVLDSYVLPTYIGTTYSLRIDSINDSKLQILSYSSPAPDSVLGKKPTSAQKQEGTFDYDRAILTYNQNPKLMLWIMTFSLMIGVSMSIAMNVIHELIRSWAGYKLTHNQLFWDGLLALIFFIALCVFNFNGDADKKYLPPFDIIADLKVLFREGVFCLIYAGEGFAFLIASASFFGTLVISSSLTNQKLIDKVTYQKLKGNLNTFLSAFSILIVFSILTISFINQALQVHFENIEKLQILKSEFIYAYGFIFSSILALIYIPINQKLYSITDPDVFKDSEGKESSSLFGNFQSMLSILAPLLGSGISDLIKTVST